MSVEWGKKPSKNKRAGQSSSAALDEFVQPGKGKTARLNINIPVELHRRIKAQCALQGRDMTEVLIAFLEERFPNRNNME